MPNNPWGQNSEGIEKGKNVRRKIPTTHPLPFIPSPSRYLILFAEMMPMPATLSRIFGWSPPPNETFVEVDVPDQPLPPQLPTFPTAEPSSPASSTSGLSDSQTEHRSESLRKGDPGWVARPRNEFILFRCDYVRKHTKDGGNKRNRRHPGQEAEKTLSKLAAEAWRALPQEERLYWREQANLERDDHARKYPDYRYRPKKCATARKRTSRYSGSMSAGVITKSIPAPALLNPITVSRSPSTEVQVPTTLMERPGSLFLDNSLRKSTSVPLLPSHAVALEQRNNWIPLALQPIQGSLDSRVNPSQLNVSSSLLSFSNAIAHQNSIELPSTYPPLSPPFTFIQLTRSLHSSSF